MAPSTHQAPPSQPQPAISETQNNLRTWWRTFNFRNTRREEERPEPPVTGVFSVPLRVSIRYANVAISLTDDDGNSYTYGYVPIVVAKCGIFLKQRALDVEGIFRSNGAERRVKELVNLFNSPDRYGKGLDWTGYTVHDAATVLRRYLNQLPEPIVPLIFYDRFRSPIKNHQAEAVGEMDHQAPSVGGFSIDSAIRTYQQLITELPAHNSQLLLYILDLLALFASKADQNLMTASNLSAIFQPGLLRHPMHDMEPNEYRLSQDVIIFLIDNQDSFLVGMKGTAVDARTTQDVQSGPAQGSRVPASPTAANRSSLIGRSASTTSAGADSVRRQGGVRRNKSVSSKNSRQSNNTPSPVTPPSGSPYLTGGKTVGVQRSNTVPSKKSPSPALPSQSFPRSQGPETPTQATHSIPNSTALEPISGVANAEDAPVAAVGKAPIPIPEAAQSQTTDPATATRSPEKQFVSGEHLQVETPQPGAPSSGRISPAGTPAKEWHFSSFFKQSGADGEKKEARKPNRLQKRRRPDGSLVSPQGSSQSLSGPSFPPSPALVAHSMGSISGQSALDGQQTQLAPRASTLPADTNPLEAADAQGKSIGLSTPSSKPQPAEIYAIDSHSSNPLKDMPQRTSGNTLRAGKESPRQSFSSRSTDNGLSPHEDGAVLDEANREKRRTWRLSRSPGHGTANEEGSSSSAGVVAVALGKASNASHSTGSFTNKGPQARESFTADSNQYGSAASSTPVSAKTSPTDFEAIVGSASPPDKKSGLRSLFKGRSKDKKDREDDKERAKSPPPIPSAQIVANRAMTEPVKDYSATAAPTFTPPPERFIVPEQQQQQQQQPPSTTQGTIPETPEAKQ